MYDGRVCIVQWESTSSLLSMWPNVFLKAIGPKNKRKDTTAYPHVDISVGFRKKFEIRGCGMDFFTWDNVLCKMQKDIAASEKTVPKPITGTWFPEALTIRTRMMDKR